jgi:hypothetical protein
LRLLSMYSRCTLGLSLAILLMNISSLNAL